MRVLVVEDDALVADAIRRGLGEAGYAVDHVDSAERAGTALGAESFDLAVVDIGLPGADGLALLQRMRRSGTAVPVLILTARDALADRVNALDLGADDYLVKPFALPELVARSRALIRRSRSAASAELVIGTLRLDLAARRAEVDGGAVSLTRREWAVLECLALNIGRVVAKDRLLQAIANWDEDIGANAIEVYVSRLRTKLGGAAPIRTVRGLGYRLDDTPG
ncbi:response regulator [Dokdonella fugitiva]|uniref:DNA-binding response OmpR family regulator n=1 Tax=Dokdonella fugitiva TaxID=328517 RepID=A0A4R2IAF5_9GAMM|nr:response regulator [Dokdonella fugitiva]MBA8885132.1 DNA-binding response OmpR family regulator [Dokdonella fugitiva]TCO41147.1 DNA-binding response OmpR family regulator [Dokdonella fugitiva]